MLVGQGGRTKRRAVGGGTWGWRPGSSALRAATTCFPWVRAPPPGAPLSPSPAHPCTPPTCTKASMDAESATSSWWYSTRDVPSGPARAVVHSSGATGAGQPWRLSNDRKEGAAGWAEQGGWGVLLRHTSRPTQQQRLSAQGGERCWWQLPLRARWMCRCGPPCHQGTQPPTPCAHTLHLSHCCPPGPVRTEPHPPSAYHQAYCDRHTVPLVCR